MVGYTLTVEEIEEILPEISFLVEEAMAVYAELKHEYASALKVTSKGGKVLAHESPMKRRIQVLNEELHDIEEEIEAMGGELRDVENGIVDFPGKFQGQDIYYCWRFGQTKVEHWHHEDEGSRGKRKIIRLGK